MAIKVAMQLADSLDLEFNDTDSCVKFAAVPVLVGDSRFFIIRHIHNHTSIISSEMQVELKENTAFT